VGTLVGGNDVSEEGCKALSKTGWEGIDIGLSNWCAMQSVIPSAGGATRR
jgi:hypothetical protein